MANDTELTITVDIPSAVKGIERSIKYERTVSKVPVNARLVASVK